MSSITRRYLAAFGLLLGLTAAVIAAWLTARWLWPALGALPTWLPEDFLTGFSYLFASELLSWVPALGLSALLLTCSYWLRPDQLPQGEVQALARFAGLAVGVTVVYAVLALLAQPWVGARLDDLAFRYKQTSQLEDAFLTLKRKGVEDQTPSDLDSMLNLLQRLGQLRPLQSQHRVDEKLLEEPDQEKYVGMRLDYDFQLQILKARRELAEFFRERTLPGVTPEDTASATIEELLDQAEAALKADDEEFRANLWGLTAYRRLTNAADQGSPLDSKLVERAKAVMDESWRRIYEKTLVSDERKRASYFFRKGKSLGDFQFQNFLEAYYGFQELHAENPDDAEVTEHWALSRQKLGGQVLFAQDMDVLFAVPGSENLVFLNSDSPREVVRIGKLLNTSQGVFVKDLEFLRTDAEGRELLHWKAPYGRWDDGIDFRVWDKDKPVPRFPVVLAEQEGNEYNPLGSVDPPRFLPRVSVRDLELVSARRPRPQTLGTADLLTHGKGIEALGYNSRLFQTEFLVRLGSPFAYFAVFILMCGLAWTNRARQEGRTWWLLIPVLPLVTEFAVETAAWSARLIVGGLLAYTELWTSIAVLAVAFVAVSIAGIIWVQTAFRRSLE